MPESTETLIEERVRRGATGGVWCLHYRHVGKTSQAPVAERCVSSRLQGKRSAILKAATPSKASTYRRKAETCRDLAACAKSAMDREQLLAMRRSWLSRAASEDWRDGLPPLPPVGTKALSAVRFVRE
jgi:hypothetical protein